MSSAVSELTGSESNTTELDEVTAERKVNEINRKPVDYSDTAGKFAMLDIGKPLCRLTYGGNVEAYVDIFLKSVPVLGGRKAVLDGSLEVKVYSEKAHCLPQCIFRRTALMKQILRMRDLCKITISTDATAIRHCVYRNIRSKEKGRRTVMRRSYPIAYGQ